MQSIWARILIDPPSPFASLSFGSTSRQTGSPSAKNYRRMIQLENALESALKKDHFATLSLVSTGENLREWTYYAKAENEFMARLNFAFAGTPEFPIEIHSASDPDWEMYEEFKAGLVEKPCQ